MSMSAIRSQTYEFVGCPELPESIAADLVQRNQHQSQNNGTKHYAVMVESFLGSSTKIGSAPCLDLGSGLYSSRPTLEDLAVHYNIQKQELEQNSTAARVHYIFTENQSILFEKLILDDEYTHPATSNSWLV